MNNIILIVFNHLLDDSRVIKYLNHFHNKYKITVICLHSSKFTKSSYYTKFPWVRFIFIPFSGNTYKKSLSSYIEWQFIIRIRTYCILRRLKGYIIANDLESLIPAYCARIHNPETVIYDSHEIWTERQGCQRTIIHKIINSMERWLEIRIVRRIKGIITISDDIAHYLKTQWQYHKSIHIVRNIPQCTYPLRSTISRQELHIDEDKILFVYTGTISKERNSDKLLSVFSKHFPHCNLLLIGRNNIKIPYNQNIFHMPAVPESELIGIISIADVGIHPLNTRLCINHQYALPNKVFQYMSAGLALCFYENQSIRDIIDKYNNGVYGSMTDECSIRENIEKLLKNDLAHMKKQSLIAAENEFNWESEMHKLDAAL